MTPTASFKLVTSLLRPYKSALFSPAWLLGSHLKLLFGTFGAYSEADRDRAESNVSSRLPLQHWQPRRRQGTNVLIYKHAYTVFCIFKFTMNHASAVHASA